MANYHVLTGLPDGNAFRVVFHISIPSANNRAGINYRSALINSGLGGSTVLPDGSGTGGTISAAEKTQIQSGAVYEHVEEVNTNPGESAADYKTRLDALHAQRVNQIQDYLSKRLTYFGYIPV
jgi:hypothetical protein